MIRRVRPDNFGKLREVFGESLAAFLAHPGPVRPVPVLQNLCDGKWVAGKGKQAVPSPVTGEPIFEFPTDIDFQPFMDQIRRCPKSGLFNPLKHPEKAAEWGNICQKTSQLMDDEDIWGALVELSQLSFPRSPDEIEKGELKSVQRTLANYSGDSIRFALKAFRVAGDRPGQETIGYRFPYGPVLIISPFNFPLKLSINNLLGALICGNFPTLKPDNRCAIQVEAFVRLMQYAGMDPHSMALLHGDREHVGKLIDQASSLFRLTQFTGSTPVADALTKQMKGRVRLEDAGFNWNIVDENLGDLDEVVEQVDKDAFGMSGQKCSALRILFLDEALVAKGFLEKLAKKSSGRKTSDGGIVPLLSLTSEHMKERVDELLAKVKNASVVLEGRRLTEYPNQPKKYGLFAPAIIRIPVETLFEKEGRHVVFREVFGPLLIVATYRKEQLDPLLESLEKAGHYLTAAITSRDPQFVSHVLSRTVNGTTYVGRARTTGAPPFQFFGPANDPRAGALGTPKCAVDQWTCHREIILDFGERNERDEALPLS